MARITRWKSRHRENSSSGSTSTSDAPMGRDLPIREKRKKLQTPQTSITGSSSSTPEDTISEGGDTANSVSGDTIALGSNAMDTDERQPDLTIHALPHKDGMIVSVRPPREPANPSLHHVPCDIVLVIDVSGSMSSEAPVPGNPGEVKERYGLSVLDLTKHAANTILETLNENDRLGIVTFASDVQVGPLLEIQCQPLVGCQLLTRCVGRPEAHPNEAQEQAGGQEEDREHGDQGHDQPVGRNSNRPQTV